MSHRHNNQQPSNIAYRCVKLPITHILRNQQQHLPIIQDAVHRTHRIVIKTYQLIRLWLLTRYHQQKPMNDDNTATDMPTTITKQTFFTAMRVIMKNSYQSKKPSALYRELSKLYTFEKEDGKFLTQILSQYVAVEMLTAFENNIKQHFFDYVRRFVNSYWKHVFAEELENKTIDRNQLRKELKKVKNDLLFGTNAAPETYQFWIQTNRYKILPKQYVKHYHYDIQKQPQKYLKHMIWMNLELEKINAKMFQCIPLRNNLIPKFIQMDNFAIISLLEDESRKIQSKRNISSIKQVLWKKFFHIGKISKIKLKNYVFDYAFSTDGYNASLRFIHLDELVKQIGIKEKKRKGRQVIKGMTKQERQKYRKTKQAKTISSAKKKAKSTKKKPSSNNTNTNNRNQKKIEFPYIDEVGVERLKGKKFVVVDPGKRDLLSMMDNEGNHLRYSNRRRITETRRFKYQRLTKNVRDKKGITELEQSLNQLNFKTCNVGKFETYLKIRNQIADVLLPLYEDIRFRQYRWYGYINRRRSEDQMANLIEKKFGKDINIIYGDWSQGKQMRHFLSTPNLGIKRKIAERFPVYNIDEYRTSKLHHQTEEKCNNLYLTDKDGTLRKKHSILTYKMENNRLGCINRDINGCLNMKKLYEAFLRGEERPLRYRRGQNTNQKIPTSPSGDVKWNHALRECKGIK